MVRVHSFNRIVIGAVFLLHLYMTIEEAYNRVKAIQLRKAVPDIMYRQRADIVLLNQLQLLSGMDSASIKLAPYKNLAYSKKKQAKNPRAGGSADLKDTGAFQNDMFLTIKGKRFEIDSKDGKSDKLKKKYKPTIFGLTDKSKQEYGSETLYPEIQKHITKVTGFKFK